MPIHPPNILSHLPPSAHLGPVDPETLPKGIFEATEEELRIAEARSQLPDPSAALNLYDIEASMDIYISFCAIIILIPSVIGLCGKGFNKNCMGVLPIDWR